MNEKYDEMDISDIGRLKIISNSSAELTSILLSKINEGICIFKVVSFMNYETIYMNDEYFNILGYEKTPYSIDLRNIMKVVLKEDSERICGKIDSHIGQGKSFDYQGYGYTVKRGRRWLRFKGFSLGKINDEEVYIMMINDETNECVNYEEYNQLLLMKEQLLREKQRYWILEETVETMLFEYSKDEDAMIISNNFPDNHERRLIHNYCETLKKGKYVHPMHIKMFTEKLNAACEKKQKGSVEYLSKISGNGYQWHRAYYTSVVDKNDNITGVMGRVDNINEEIENRKKYQYDGLTGTLLRSAGYECMEAYIREYPGKEVYLILVDLDNFKYINDTFGHLAGDEVLKKFARYVMEIFNGCGIVTRFGGDEFLIFVHDLKCEEIDKKLDELKEIIKTIDYGNLEFCYGMKKWTNGTLDEAFELIDKEMYEQKKIKGRQS